MHTAHPDDIVVLEDRVRKEFTDKDHRDLKVSLKLQLLHPPVCNFDRDLGKPILVAGERRLRALRELVAEGTPIFHNGKKYEGEIPYTDLSDLTPEQHLELEIEENTRRKNLTWQEEAAGISKLATLRSGGNLQAHGLKVQIAREIQPEGETLDNTQKRVREALVLAEHLDDPEVSKAKSVREAIKILEKKADVVLRAERAAEYKAAGGHSLHRLYPGDCRTLFGDITTGSVDCIIADPPYGIGADSFGDQSGAGHLYDDSPENAMALVNTLASEGFRVCRGQAHAYVFCDLRLWSDFSASFQLEGWEVWPLPLIWDKGNGMLPRPEHGPRRVYEAVLFASKGGRKVTSVKHDVIRVPGVRRPLHGAQKPVGVYVDLLERSVRPGDVVLDPFAGSGTIFAAANRLQLKAIGFELEEEYYNLALTRMDSKDDGEEEEEELTLEIPGL